MMKHGWCIVILMNIIRWYMQAIEGCWRKLEWSLSQSWWHVIPKKPGQADPIHTTSVSALPVKPFHSPERTWQVGKNDDMFPLKNIKWPGFMTVHGQIFREWWQKIFCGLTNVLEDILPQKNPSGRDTHDTPPHLIREAFHGVENLPHLVDWQPSKYLYANTINPEWVCWCLTMIHTKVA